MAIVMTTVPMQLSKASPGLVIKNPNETQNIFTATKQPEASAALNISTKEGISDLKHFLKDYDMSAISTDDLKKVGRYLYNSGAIDSVAFGMFISGRGEFDDKGNQANTHLPYNAIALFNQKLEDYTKFLEDYPVHATQDNLAWKQGMVSANHAIGALTYFANSPSSKLSVDIQA